jgi:hypothetical protein
MKITIPRRRGIWRGDRHGQRFALGLMLVAMLATAPAEAWGPVAHQFVTAKAIDTLPKELKKFYKEHRYELPSLSVEASFPEEGIERRFAVDHLFPFPFDDLPRSETALASQLGEEATDVGRLPWLIHESYFRLVEAFSSGDKARILAESDTLAGLVTDLHNPLALSDNADGQKTGQHGLWVRFSVRLPEAMEGDLDLDPDVGHYLDEPKEHVFSLINATYIWLDNLLYNEELARRGKGGYTEIYYADFARRVRPIVNLLLSEAAGESGSFWYTAWTQAGRPKLE